MKNIFKKAFCFLLTISALFGVFGCSNSDDSSQSSSQAPVQTVEKPVDKSTFEGVHDFTMTETSNYLVKDGKTDYKLVLAEELAAIETQAKEEFITLFQQATGIKMPTMKATDMKHDPNGKYICLGENDMFADSGIEIDKEALTSEGVRIVTKDQTVYIVGGGYYGTLYAVYDFMQLTFNYEQYYLDCMEIETGVKEKKLYNYDVTDIPDIAKRTTGYAFMTDQFKNRMRIPMFSGSYLLPIHEKMNEIDGKYIADRNSIQSNVHNSLKYLPRNDYATEHPDWYGDSGEVLCYTAHGNEEELELMALECAKKVEASLRAYPATMYPYMNAVSLTVEDNNDTCACEACTACAEEYGTLSASLILFINRFNEHVRDMMSTLEGTEYYRETFEIVFFAYNSFALAPASWDEEAGAYVPNAPELKLGEGVRVWLAFMNLLEEEISIYHPKNERGRTQIEKWSALSDGLWLWTYSTNFTEYLYFHDAFSLYNAEGYRFFADYNIKMYYQNAQSYQKGASTAFHSLSIYLQSKLAWNTSLDTEELVNKFMKAMYKEAAPIMMEMLTSMRLHNREIKEATQYVNSVAYAYNYPYNTLKNWTDMCDEALAKIDSYRTQDPKTYKMLKTHIDTEWIFPAYATLQLQSDKLLEADLVALKARFKETGLRLGITQIKEIETTNAFVDYLNSL